MIVGLPGTGIGGLYYLLASTWMPVQEAFSAQRKGTRLSRWRMIARLVLITLAIAGGFWATGQLVGMLFVLLGISSAGMAQHHTMGLWLFSDGKINILSANLFYWALGTLVVLYIAMHMLRLMLRLSRLPGLLLRSR